jgi:hypothetical protein
MLAKLNHNKSFLLILFFCIISCKNIFNSKPRVPYDTPFNTEVLCANGKSVLIKYARLDEVRAAIVKANQDKKIEHTSESYTPIRLPQNRSFRIEKMTPEEALGCSLRETGLGQVDRNYVRHF